MFNTRNQGIITCSIFFCFPYSYAMCCFVLIMTQSNTLLNKFQRFARSTIKCIIKHISAKCWSDLNDIMVDLCVRLIEWYWGSSSTWIAHEQICTSYFLSTIKARHLWGDGLKGAISEALLENDHRLTKADCPSGCLNSHKNRKEDSKYDTKRIYGAFTCSTGNLVSLNSICGLLFSTILQ